eukprot:Hpha_TRINITY_DN16185_c2_g4::TRINITY_DN16185_c2_g4_i2::g.5527::m.5527
MLGVVLLYATLGGLPHQLPIDLLPAPPHAPGDAVGEAWEEILSGHPKAALNKAGDIIQELQPMLKTIRGKFQSMEGDMMSLKMCQDPCCTLSLNLGSTPLPLKLCATETCLSLPDLNFTTCMSPELAECARNQTPSMAAASGIKLGSVLVMHERIIGTLLQALFSVSPSTTGYTDADFGGSVMNPFIYPISLGAAVNVGDEAMCRAASGRTRYCVWNVGTVLTGSCVPAECSVDIQKEAVYYQSKVWQELGVAIGNFLKMPEIGYATEAIAYYVDGVASYSLVTCSNTLTRVDITTEDHSDTTAQRGFFGDEGAQGVAALIAGIALVNIVCSIAVRMAPKGLPRVVRCFDLAAARDSLFRLSPRRDTSFLNGIRVISIMWVVLGHCLVWPRYPGFDNQIELDKYYLQSPRFVLVPSGLLAVDTFFFLSGFLACYGLTDERKGWRKRVPGNNIVKNGFAMIMVYVDRYVRLTPLYGLLILFAVYLLQYMGSGPFWGMVQQGGEIGYNCDKYWYANVLYMNNMPHYSDHLCYAHSWYLANDFQFLVVGVPIVVIFTRVPALAWFITIGLTLMSWGIVIWKVHTSQDAAMGGASYIRPYTRCAPYMYGLMACFLLRQRRDCLRELVSRPLVRTVAYVVGFGLMAGCVVLQWDAWKQCGGYGFCDRGVKWAHPWGGAMTRAFSWFYHFAWGLGLLILTIVWTAGAKEGAGGWVVDFLSYPGFEPLYRLTYGVYLIHPMVLVLLKLTVSHLIHYTDYWLLSTWTSGALGAYIASTITYLFVEHPCGQLWDLISGKSKRSQGKGGGDGSAPVAATTQNGSHRVYVTDEDTDKQPLLHVLPDAGHDNPAPSHRSAPV